MKIVKKMTKGNWKKDDKGKLEKEENASSHPWSGKIT